MSEAAKLYVIPGSHACRTGMLLLEHKGVSYEPVNLITGLQPWALRLLRFPAKARRTAQLGEGRHRNLGAADRMGTVPALRYGPARVSTNREIARFLDRVQPEPPLFPADSEERRAVEEAERWGDEVLQMTARRLTLAAAQRGADAIKNQGDDGRLGYLLYRNSAVRRRMARLIGRYVFEVDASVECRLLAELPTMLDRIDASIAAGVLNAGRLNAADYMIAPSLALLTYRVDLEHEIAARPAGGLVDRLLPEPAISSAEELAAASAR